MGNHKGAKLTKWGKLPHRTAVRLSPQDKEMLEKLKELTGKDGSEVMRMALAEKYISMGL